jgi:hypothetical protein
LIEQVVFFWFFSQIPPTRLPQLLFHWDRHFFFALFLKTDHSFRLMCGRAELDIDQIYSLFWLLNLASLQVDRIAAVARDDEQPDRVRR